MMSGCGKKTVLFVNPTLDLGGDMQSLYNMIESLKNEITPIVLMRGREKQAYAFFSSRGVECIVHPYLTCYTLPFWKNIKNVLLHPWRARVFKWMRNDLTCLFYVKRQLAGRRLDLIHSNSFRVRVGSFLAVAMHVPHVWHVREYMDYWGPRRIAGGLWWHKVLMNKADARVMVSTFCRRVWGLKKEATWVLWDAVRSQADCCYEREKQPYLLFCSYWINKEKGAGTAVAAFGRSGLFKADSGGIRLLLVGVVDEGYKNELLALAGRYGCAEFIDFYPVQENVKPFFTNSRGFVNPSVNEGLGRTTAEAMFFGCPVIAHASGGSLELVKDGETGYLFHTEEECAKLMKLVCTTSQEDIILRAQAFARQYLSVEQYGVKIMDVYNSVLGCTR